MVLKIGSDQSVMVRFGSIGWAVEGLDRHRIGWISDRTSKLDELANSLWIARFNPFFLSPLIKMTSFWCFWPRNDFVLITIKAFFFFPPPQLLQTLPVVPSHSPGYHCQLSTQSPLVLVPLDPLAIAAEDPLSPNCCKSYPPSLPTAQVATANPTTQAATVSQSPPVLVLPNSLVATDEVHLVAVTVTFQFLHLSFYFSTLIFNIFTFYI